VRPRWRVSRRAVLDEVRLALDAIKPVHIGIFFVILALGIYVFSNPARLGWYDHFVWQADAFLHGRFAIAYPVTEGPNVNGYFQDVMPLPTEPGAPSYGLLPFPPLPAVLLMPFVAMFGLAADDQLLGAILGAINVGLAWRMVTRLTERNSVAALATLFFAFGTVHWYAAMLSTTWFLAHVVATTFLLIGITLALDAERREQLRARFTELFSDDAPDEDQHEVVATFEESSLFLAWLRALRANVDGMQFAAGLVFGIAALARLPVILGAPFFVFVGGGGSYRRRALSAGLGAVIPVALLLAYNLAATGHLFNPAYEWLYQHEYLGYLPPGFEIDRSWGIEDPRHIPRNSLIMLGWPPEVTPQGTDCGLSLFDPSCPVLRPSTIGMSIFLTSPAYLLAVPVIATAWRKRVVMGSLLAIGAIALLNLAHFSQGWVQFGYRFSNDFAPFALILVTLGIARLGVRWLSVGLVAASIVINAWGVYWGVKLGW
jgi:hypothetical protein